MFGVYCNIYQGKLCTYTVWRKIIQGRHDATFYSLRNTQDLLHPKLHVHVWRLPRVREVYYSKTQNNVTMYPIRSPRWEVTLLNIIPVLRVFYWFVVPRLSCTSCTGTAAHRTCIPFLVIERTCVVNYTKQTTLLPMTYDNAKQPKICLSRYHNVHLSLSDLGWNANHPSS